MSSNNSIKHVEYSGLQTTFFGKVMFFFTLAVATTALGVYLTQTYFLEQILSNSILFWGIMIGELALIFTSGMWGTKTPLNRFLITLFAFLSGVTLTPLIAMVTAAQGGGEILTKALVATAAVFGALGIIGYTTQKDLSGLRGFLIASLIGLIVVNVLGIFFPWGSVTELLVSGFGIVLFSGFVMYDFNQLKNYPEDMYINAAISLYLDIFNLFVYILRFMLALASNE